jgi:hypothetical protein
MSYRNKRKLDKPLVVCRECKKYTNWTTDECVWMVRRKNGILHRAYYHLDCFNAIAGEEITESIVAQT